MHRRSWKSARPSGISSDGDARVRDPLQDGVADELRPVVRPHEQRRAVQAHQPRQHFDHAPGTNGSGHVDGQTFTGVFVHDGQALDLLTAGRGVEDEVVGPDHVGLEGCVDARTYRGDALARALPGHQQARLAPQPMRARPTELEALATQEDADATVAVARVLRRELPHRSEHWRILGRQAQLVARGGPRHSDQPAGAAQTQPPCTHEVQLHASCQRAHHFFALISLRISTSRSRSASSFFRRLFSSSRALSRLTSAASI